MQISHYRYVLKPLTRRTDVLSCVIKMRFNIGLTGAILIIFGNICASVILYFPHKPSGLIPIKSMGRLQVRLTSSDNELMNASISCSNDLEKILQEKKKIGQFI